MLANRLFTVAITSICLATPAGGQSLVTGTWRGVFKLTRGPEVSLDFIVGAPPDSSDPIIRLGDGSTTPVTTVSSSDKGLAFHWGTMACRLKSNGRRHEGDCRADDGTTGRLTLEAPAITTGSPSNKRSDVLTREELVATQRRTVGEAVSQLRPQWLRGRVDAVTELAGIPPLTGFVDGKPLGGVDELRDMPIDQVVQVRYYGSSDAIVRFGKRYEGGVIDVAEH
jgi:hypothetical protein